MKSLTRHLGIILIGLIISFFLISCDNNGSSSRDAGIYLGIIGFDETIAHRNISLLTENNVGQFQHFIERLGPPHHERKGYTQLYNAVDRAINMLQSASLPDDVTEVAIITFTDGLDNMAPARREEISNRVKTAEVKGLNIHAFAVGVMGQDIQQDEIPAFLADLAVVATSTDNEYVRSVADMTDLDVEFTEIANSLYFETQSQRIRVRIPSAWANNTRIRLTFDNVATAASSTFYIEGTLQGAPNADRPVVNKFYRGFGVNNDSTPATVRGTHSGHRLTLNFDIVPVAGLELDTKNVQLWRWRDDFEFWQRESEFGNEVGDIETVAHRSSAVIMLVLDRSLSLDDDEFLKLQSAAKTFIDALLGGKKKDSQDIEHENPPCAQS